MEGTIRKGFIRRSNHVYVSDLGDFKSTLEPGLYGLRYDKCQDRYYLEDLPDFNLPEKLYGNVESLSSRFLDSYLKTNKNTGVLLSGTKGSGKTLTAKRLAQKAIALGIPVILVNSDQHGETFFEFWASLTQKAVVIFDEMDKVYNYQSQQKVLTLLDGVITTNKLWVLTCNNQYAIDEHMINRTGRIRYHIEYASLDKETILEYCKDHIKDKDAIEEIVNLSKLVSITYDVLNAIIQELNLFGGTVKEVVGILNISVARSDSFIGVLTDVDGNVVGRGLEVDSHPAFNATDVSVMINGKYSSFYFEPANVTKITKDNSVILVNGDGYTLECKANKTKSNTNPYDFIAKYSNIG